MITHDNNNEPVESLDHSGDSLEADNDDDDPANKFQYRPMVVIDHMSNTMSLMTKHDLFSMLQNMWKKPRALVN
jgi:hypothetical protein